MPKNGYRKEHPIHGAGAAVNRTGRLLELMITLNSRRRYTVKELANHFSVSRRTILRDMHLLSEMGVPLASAPGPHGGYSLIKTQQLPAISFTTSEAIGMIMSYEALDAYPDGPFRAEHDSALTKLRSILPAEVLEEVRQFQRYVLLDVPRRQYETPFIMDVLQAAQEGTHLEIEYESTNGVSKRVILPYGLIASNGFWYCPSHCYKRNERVWFRVDRIQGVLRREDFDGGAPTIPISEIRKRGGHEQEQMIRIRATLTEKGCKMGEWHPQFGGFIQKLPEGTGIIDREIFPGQISLYGRFFLSLGTEVRVEEPVEMIEFLRSESEQIQKQYEGNSRT